MKILCIHQSADLYGSDKSFLQVLRILKESKTYSVITVVLPKSGPLVKEIENLGIEVIYWDLSLLSKTYLTKLRFDKIIFPLVSIFEKLKFANKYEVVYVNTSVILDFYLIGRFLKGKGFIHIREIPAKWFGKILSILLKFSSLKIIFNSYSTQKSFSVKLPGTVIHNAFEGFECISNIQSYKSNEFENRPLKLLLIGRINSWKGQRFAIEALSKMNHRNFQLKIVGDTSVGNEILIDSLYKLIDEKNLKNQVSLEPFTQNPEVFYDWCDVLIIPSTKPEPFGRIAIEAMSLHKPVIAAAHGGLIEIVTHNVDGFLFEPNNVYEFIASVSAYYSNPSLIFEHGENAFHTYLDKFSMTNFRKSIYEFFKS